LASPILLLGWIDDLPGSLVCFFNKSERGKQAKLACKIPVRAREKAQIKAHAPASNTFKMAKWFRSEPMEYISIIMNEDAAHDCLADLGKLGAIQFTDVSIVIFS
jgi:hypothetical protein